MSAEAAAVEVVVALARHIPGIIDLLNDRAKEKVMARLAASRAGLPEPGAVRGPIETAIAEAAERVGGTADTVPPPPPSPFDDPGP